MFSCCQFQVTKHRMPCMSNMLPVLKTKKVPQKENMFNSVGSMELLLLCKDITFMVTIHIYLVKSASIDTDRCLIILNVDFEAT